MWILAWTRPKSVERKRICLISFEEMYVKWNATPRDVLIMVFLFVLSGAVGVPDMTVISDIDEEGINKNLQARYSKDLIYVSFLSYK